MRASPAFRIAIDRFELWRAAVVVATVLALLTLVAWWVAGGPANVRVAWAAACAALALFTLTSGAGLLRIRPCVLRWDTQRWHLEPSGVDMGVDASTSGHLSVAIDLGAWMLLKFERDRASRNRRVVWLPVQRLGMPGQWHALRCAVYCARSAPGPDAASDSASRPEPKE